MMGRDLDGASDIDEYVLVVLEAAQRIEEQSSRDGSAEGH